MRLDKFLAETGVGSRSQVKQLLKKGLVSVNGVVVKDPGQKVLEDTDEVRFAGEVLSYQRFAYYMLYKPAGCVTARSDRWHRTVMDYLPQGIRGDLAPVGRLDLDTEGLLLITNDGALSHRLLSPACHVEKTYFARVAGDLKPEYVELFREGLDIGDEKPTAPARLAFLGTPGAEGAQKNPTGSPVRETPPENPTGSPVGEVLLTITEGRFHQVKRMFQAVGCEVTYLKRISMGGLTLDEGLSPGECRLLTKEELERIL